MKRLFLFLLLPLFVSACATTGAGPGLGLCEYDTGTAGLNQDEFETGVFDDWDTDDDGLLSDDEFGVGVNDWGWDWNNEFGVWDDDDDDFLSEDEFGAGFNDTGVWDTWDEDDSGYLDEDECVV